MKTLDTIRQSVLDHDAPTPAELASRISRHQRRMGMAVLAMVVGAFIAREVLASYGASSLILWLLSALLAIWACMLVVGLLLQPFVKSRYERKVFAHVGSAEMEESAHVIERLPGVAPVVDRWIRTHGGLRRLDYDVLHAAGQALDRLGAAKALHARERTARSTLRRALDEKQD